MKNLIALLLSSLVLVGCGYTRHYDHVEAFEMEVYAAPEVRGAGSYKEPNTANVRLSANVHAGPQEKERLHGLVNKMDGCRDVVNCEGFKPENVQENVDGTYKMAYPILNASLDYISKKELFLWGFSFAVDKGFYASLLLGINTRYFEVGASIGWWNYFRRYKYSGTSYDCDHYWGKESLDAYPFNSSNGVGQSFTYGGYASAYYGPFSLNFSVNVYRPDASYPGESSDRDSGYGDILSDFEFPLVVTEYITAGYRINPQWELRLGASNVLGEFPGWHWGATGGISYYTK
jgi:hypothetical protein